MKHFILLFALFFSSLTFSQVSASFEPRFSFGLYHQLDTDFNLSPRLEMVYELPRDDIGSFAIGVAGEVSRFDGGKVGRYIPRFGYNARGLSIGNKKEIFFDYAAYFGAGWTFRDFGEDFADDMGNQNYSYFGFEVSNEIAFFMNDWFSLNVKGVFSQRGDLTRRDVEDPLGLVDEFDWRFNLFAGVKIYIR
jgi:hypothetical protein